MSKPNILVPLVTPLDAHGEVCERSVQRLIHACGPLVDGFIPCLTSGEGWRLSPRQWSDMLGHTLRHALPVHQVVAGIELASTEAVIERAQLAQTLGAAAIMVASPFGGGASQEALFEHYRCVHDSTPLPLMVYNEAALSGNEKNLETLLRIAKLPRVIGLKDSPSQPRTQAEVDQLRQAGVAYYIGWEQELAGRLISDGNVVSLANVEPALCRLAWQPGQPGLAALITQLDAYHQLGEPAWYEHLKRELVARGTLACAATVPELAQ
ncbi:MULTISPECIES: dihydrodipicolinate synthase family protein [unclassified Pseudomonas]|uniref:dihydrodipicolinate synthase family protein n=1 Tax=unclassified Pseudomonas TaxID=196821 RepID=UPI000BCEC79A|nr:MULTISPECIES: dihydrodipicolinate synthase family protein [unclassified Pseudomonas]PVZ19780.1 4-hydroxy-tetrahydrodipicolinate synthase [Pseudomonas sp. URIL14HWK12:I12]PVZ26846.1 4-hydroxy-tetrahydrodipicolinate synthase [Pseudomonas sp. URIL14HWK12:I10]PVZ37735.1 4-hydroxy-tetrahydrodipicolinate synthase [Pseudomonas sp. URIL14HWK12:I11]SNZ05877.1 4-hydroxy-tetrahydrodipicolinate synthase [Pseudomonas sp. URIL14HWK12:I9]